MPAIVPDVPLEQSRHGCCIKKTLALIDELALPGIAASEYRDFVSIRAATKLPSVIVAPYGRRYDANAGPCGKDEFELGVVIAVVAKNNRDSTGATLGWRLKCIEQIEDKFLNTRHDAQLPTGGCIKRIVTEPGEEFMEEAYKANLDASFLLVYWIIQRVRP